MLWTPRLSPKVGRNVNITPVPSPKKKASAMCRCMMSTTPSRSELSPGPGPMWGGRMPEVRTTRKAAAAADPAEPESDERLEDNAGGAVHALDEADLRLRPSEPLDVEGQEDEAAEARHEHEVGEGGPGERSAADELEPANHGRCGPLSPRRKIAAPMARPAIIRDQCSMWEA